MGDALKKVRPGDPLRIPAAAYNAFIDAAMDRRWSQNDRTGGMSQEKTGSGIVLVKNNTGADQDRFAVLGVDAPLYGPEASPDSFKNRLALAGVVPAASHAGRFVILAEPSRSGDIGRAAAAGLSIVRVQVREETDIAADVAAGQTSSLRSGPAGAARILWKEAGTGLKWAVVRLDESVGRGAEDYMVLQMVAGARVWDWVRAHE